MKIKVKVNPGAKKERILKLDDGSYLVWMTTPPLAGKANKTLIRMLAEEFKVTANDISIKTPAGRKKIVDVRLGGEKDEI